MSRPRGVGRPLVVLALLALGLLLVLPQPSARAAEKYAALVIDAQTGATLHERFADAPRYPASLTKMMTLYIVFEELQAGRLTLDSRLKASANAARQAPSKLGIRAGQTIRVEDAIKALAVKSANDVAVVIAENIEGSVPAFARRMTRTARTLGMSRTTFTNPHGLPDPAQRTTARDMARLGVALQRFPRYYRYFGTRTFSHGRATYRNTNRLLGSVSGVDGIKTGYTRASGFNLVTSVRSGNRRIVAVVMGGATGAARNARMKQLIASYLPAAKPGSGPAPMLVAAAEPQTAPLPRVRPGYEPAALVAADAVGRPAAEAASGDAAVALAALTRATPVERPADPIAARISAAEEVARLAYAPSRRGTDDPIARLAELAQSKAAAQPAADHSGTRPAAAAAADPGAERAGWHVQIGAVPSEAGANALLDKARTAAGKLLADADPFTQPVEKDGATLYRARFAGFADKNEARATCNALKRKAISCLAVPN